MGIAILIIIMYLIINIISTKNTNIQYSFELTMLLISFLILMIILSLVYITPKIDFGDVKTPTLKDIKDVIYNSKDVINNKVDKIISSVTEYVRENSIIDKIKNEIKINEVYEQPLEVLDINSIPVKNEKINNNVELTSSDFRNIFARNIDNTNSAF